MRIARRHRIADAKELKRTGRVGSQGLRLQRRQGGIPAGVIGRKHRAFRVGHAPVMDSAVEPKKMPDKSGIFISE